MAGDDRGSTYTVVVVVLAGAINPVIINLDTHLDAVYIPLRGSIAVSEERAPRHRPRPSPSGATTIRSPAVPGQSMPSSVRACHRLPPWFLAAHPMRIEHRSPSPRGDRRRHPFEARASPRINARPEQGSTSMQSPAGHHLAIPASPACASPPFPHIDARTARSTKMCLAAPIEMITPPPAPQIPTFQRRPGPARVAIHPVSAHPLRPHRSRPRHVDAKTATVAPPGFTQFTPARSARVHPRALCTSSHRRALEAPGALSTSAFRGAHSRVAFPGAHPARRSGLRRGRPGSAHRPARALRSGREVGARRASTEDGMEYDRWPALECDRWPALECDRWPALEYGRRAAMDTATVQRWILPPCSDGYCHRAAMDTATMQLTLGGDAQLISRGAICAPSTCGEAPNLQILRASDCRSVLGLGVARRAAARSPVERTRLCPRASALRAPAPVAPRVDAPARASSASGCVEASVRSRRTHSPCGCDSAAVSRSFPGRDVRVVCGEVSDVQHFGSVLGVAPPPRCAGPSPCCGASRPSARRPGPSRADVGQTGVPRRSRARTRRTSLVRVRRRSASGARPPFLPSRAHDASRGIAQRLRRTFNDDGDDDDDDE